MKKILSFILASVMAISLVACSSSSSAEDAVQGEPLVLVGMSSNETNINILVDQLKKAGFNIETNIQPDYASFSGVIDSGEYDIAFSGWTTVTGNPDYAVRDIFGTNGAYNNQGLDDAKVNELIDTAAAQTPAEYVSTYTELENYLVKEQAYIVPLFSSLRIMAMDTDLIDVDSVSHPKSASSAWPYYSYNDESLNATRPLITTQTSSVLTSLDPIQANDGSINSLSSNMNVRIVNLTEEDEVTADRSLSYNFAIAEGNSDFYFLLKDNVNFADVQDKAVVDTGVRVGAEDVVFTLNRAKDETSVPSHKTYGLHSHMQEISIVTDLEELNTVLDSDTGLPVLETLVAGVENEVTTLTADKTQADNANGTYQVVKVTTKAPFPQVLNYLAHQSAGILSEQQVTAINSEIDMENYDPTTDVIYGDFNYLKQTDNHLWTSGGYALTYVDDYEVEFQINPGFMPGTEDAPRIQTIVYKFIKDNTSALASFRSGEVDLLPFVDTTSVELLEGEEGVEVMQRSSNGVSYCYFNLAEGRETTNQDLRLAVLNSIDQNAFIAVNNGLLNPAYSTLSTIIDTGNVLVQDLETSKTHFDAYLATTAE